MTTERSRVCSDAVGAFAEAIREEGFVFVAGAQLRAALGGPQALGDFPAFAASWNDLALDTNLPDGHRYRRRRHGTFSAGAGHGSFDREPHAPHYQAREYNRLVGGIERWFEPIAPRVASGATFARVVEMGLELYGALSPGADWHIEAHQFRIEARADGVGLPTPEGMHRDGVDYVTVLLVDRVNIRSGTTMLESPDGNPLGSFTLAQPLDAALLDDRRVLHGVTPVQPLDPSLPAWRDVLVVTYRAAGGPAAKRR